MKVLELFAGTRSIGKAFEARGHEVFSVDWNGDFEGIDLAIDIAQLTVDDVLQLFGKPDVIWASPDCTTYSVAAISTYRQFKNGKLLPVTDYAKQCDFTNVHVLELIQQLKPKYWFIENPRGAMRKMHFMRGLPRYTVTYCQYGKRYMKPTDIWTNHPQPRFKKHVAAVILATILRHVGQRLDCKQLQGMLKRLLFLKNYASTLLTSAKTMLLICLC